MFTDDRHPDAEELVSTIRYTNGEEAIVLTNGGEIRYSARSRQAARGFAGVSLVVYDEAQELTDEQVEALMPTLAASATGTRQVIYTGTPPYPPNAGKCNYWARVCNIPAKIHLGRV
nr:MAG TPA: Terminase [Caudoviricetes sp.]